MFNTSILTTAIIVITIAMKQVSSYTEACIGEFCFTTPDSTELRYFDGAKSWCTNKKSDLAVVSNSDVQMALTQFLKSSNTSAMSFINIKLSQLDQANTWFLLKGSRYDGYVGSQDVNGYKLYCYLKSYGNYFQVEASKPSEINRYICDFQGDYNCLDVQGCDATRCLNNSTNSILYNGKCYVKFENDTLTWCQARERCLNNGGDLATFQSGNIYQLTSSWLNPSLTYWVGIRWNDWSWKSPDGGSEAFYTSWSSEKPNNYNFQCVCVDPNGNPAWSWTDCSCGDQRQFVCLKIVPTTTTSTTTTTTTTRAPTISTTSEVIPGSKSNSTSNALAIGLGAGLGGGLFLIGLVVLVVVVVMLMRKRRRKNNGVESRHIVENTTTTTTTNIEMAASNGPDVYAQIVPTAQHPANNKPPNEVIYEKPEFSNNQNSASSGSDPTNLRQGRVQSIMLEGSNDLYANATSAS